MAQLERVHRHTEAPRTPTSAHTVEQLLREAEFSKVSPTSSSISSPSSPFFRHHDVEEDHGHHQQKKSVLTKVKEKAKKLRQSLSKKKHEDNVTPSWGVTLEEDEDEEDNPEYLGAPMYESELAPEGYKEHARQHPRASPVISEKHVLQNTVKPGIEQSRIKPLDTTRRITETVNTIPLSPRKKLPESPRLNAPESAAEKLTRSVSNAKGSYAGNSVSSKFQGLTISKPTEYQFSSAPSARRTYLTPFAPLTPPARMVSQTPSAAPVSPQTSSAPVTPQTSSSPMTLKASSASASPLISGKNINPSGQVWDKGVSVKEYFMNKFEPGEDEKALSQVISEAMSPRRTPGDAGVMEKVREAVTSLLRSEEPSQHAAVKTPTMHTSASTSSSRQIPVSSSPSLLPVSTNPHEADQEENHGRILQAN